MKRLTSLNSTWPFSTVRHIPEAHLLAFAVSCFMAAATVPHASAQATLSPASITLSEGQTQQFTAGSDATWKASCGSISGTGLYTAPLAPESCTVTATSYFQFAQHQQKKHASAAVTVTSPITLTPSAVSLHALNTQQFSASAPVTWSTSCGSISPSGVFTAPASARRCTLTATASGGTRYTALANASIDVVNYTSWKGGGNDIGALTDELSLTPSNVSATSFGLIWQASVDGWVTAQPLYMNGLTINGTPHNVVFIATNNDSIYAFDGDTGTLLWKTSLIPPGATAVAASSIGYTSLQPLFGILGTPAINPSTRTMYVVAETSEQGATYFPHRLHAIDITTGQEKFGGPVLISNSQMAPVLKLQRPGLLLAKGNVYVGIGALQDREPYNGMLFAFNAATLAEESVWVDTPTGHQGGIWMGGASPSVDGNGNVYVATGNGTFDGTSNFGEAAIKLTPGLQLLDYFAPYNFSADNAGDLDLGSGGVLVVPDQTGPYPHELIVCGKPSSVFVLNGDNLGHVGTTTDNIIQRLDTQVGNPSPKTGVHQACLTSPAMWGQNIYFGGEYDVLKMFTLNPATGLLSTAPVSQSTVNFGSLGADPVISANGATNGIVWTVDTSAWMLRAMDATDLSHLLFSYPLTAGVTRWTIPTVVNGHVYLGEEGTVFAFGLK